MLVNMLKKIFNHVTNAILRRWDNSWPVIKRLPFYWKYQLTKNRLLWISKYRPDVSIRIKKNTVQQLLTCLESQPIFLIQIGANDGRLSDPIFSHVIHSCWKGILIEPIPYYYESLKRNYSGNVNLIFENIAIGTTESKSPENYVNIYRIDERIIEEHFKTHQWLHGQPSFNKEIVESEINSHFQGKDAKLLINNIKVEKVKCMTLHQLLAKHGIIKIDLLQIDTQGYDYKIIMSLNFNAVKIKMINFESMFFSSEQSACNKKLADAGYRVLQYGLNTFAFLDKQ